ncbi:MAG TPA: bifunctional nuclease family protein [Armatimonadota bacterium]|nr:bifunctional nuclease family protein [Armatimonadota bacterium]
MGNIPVEVWQVARDDDGRDVVLLRDAQGRVLSIAIGVCEAAAIWVALARDQQTPYVRRPWSHDLMQSMLERLDAQLQSVVIDGFSNGVFYATLQLAHRGQELFVDARPSDAIALLLRAPAPLFVNADVMDEESVSPFDDNGDMPHFGDGEGLV